MRHIDMATGIGLMIPLILRYHDKFSKNNTATVNAVDLNESMLSIAKIKFQNTRAMSENRLTFEAANAENLTSIPDNTYDVYSVFPGLHNMPHSDKAINEAYRILKPGGKFVCIEFGHVDSVIGRILQLSSNILILVMYIPFAKVRNGYAQLHQSRHTFGSQQELGDVVRRAGFVVHGKGYRNTRGGIADLTVGIESCESF